MSEFLKNQEGLSSIIFLITWFVIILCVSSIYVKAKSEKIKTYTAYILLFICPILFLPIILYIANNLKSE